MIKVWRCHSTARAAYCPQQYIAVEGAGPQQYAVVDCSWSARRSSLRPLWSGTSTAAYCCGAR
eukprot:9188927-Lingulodinium_polyedra.AAC.1